MKITKNELKQIIKEELEKYEQVEEAEGSEATTEKPATDFKKQLEALGFNPQGFTTIEDTYKRASIQLEGMQSTISVQISYDGSVQLTLPLHSKADKLIKVVAALKKIIK